jgi:hypothetical protein
VFSRPFQRYITSPQIPKIVIGKTKENLQLFSDCRAGWSKELQWENDNVFCKCIEGKSGICLLLAMFTTKDWMINLMIIYIKKIIAKALDFDDIIKFFYGDVNSMSPNLSINNQIRPSIEI